jgi:hypothetical protein
VGAGSDIGGGGGIFAHAGVQVSSLVNETAGAAIDVPAQQLQYQLGAPNQIESGGQSGFTAMPRLLKVDLDASQNVRSYQCDAQVARPDVCPTPLGIEIADPEDAIFRVMGCPAASAFRAITSCCHTGTRVTPLPCLAGN